MSDGHQIGGLIELTVERVEVKYSFAVPWHKLDLPIASPREQVGVVLQGGRQDAERLFQPTADDVDGLRAIGGEDNLARVSAKKPGRGLSGLLELLRDFVSQETHGSMHIGDARGIQTLQTVQDSPVAFV